MKLLIAFLKDKTREISLMPNGRNIIVVAFLIISGWMR